jgi:hypothetical protein
MVLHNLISLSSSKRKSILIRSLSIQQQIEKGQIVMQAVKLQILTNHCLLLPKIKIIIIIIKASIAITRLT